MVDVGNFEIIYLSKIIDIIQIGIKCSDVRHQIDFFAKHDLYKPGILLNLRNTLVPLRDDFINQTITREKIVQHIQEMENKHAPSKVKTRNPVFEVNDASYQTRHQCRTFNIIMNSSIAPHLVGCKPIRPTEIKIKIREIERVSRDYFNDDELEQIANSYENDLERLIFTIFLTIGLRIGAVVDLKIKNMFEKDCLNVLETGDALEKAGKTRTFVIFPVLKQALLKYRDAHKDYFKGQEYFLFPYKFKPSDTSSVNKTTINDIFMKVCKRANVTGDQVRTHACRKTVVVNLMKDGNTIDNVAKFIGHSNPITTAQHYWVTTPAELVASMNISWLVGPAIMSLNSSNDKEVALNSTSSSTSGPTLKQIQKIAVTIAEGLKAKEKLNHAVSLMSKEQLEVMETMWGEQAKEHVANNTKNIMIEIAEAASTFVSRSQSNLNKI